MIQLDTQVWVWWTTADRKLSRKALLAIEGADAVCLSAVSVLEATYAHRRGRLSFTISFQQWLSDALTGSNMDVVPLDHVIAQCAGELDWDHGDPADRAIVATAQVSDVPLVTSDRRILRSGLVETIWK